MHLWSFPGRFEFGLQGGSVTCQTPFHHQHQNSKRNLGFESVLVLVKVIFSVLQSWVICSTLVQDFDNRHMMVDRLFLCFDFGNYNALLGAMTSTLSFMDCVSILARIVYLTIKEIAFSFDGQT